MISIVERRRLPADTERVWAFFQTMDDNYRRWHQEHLEWRTVRGDPLTDGAAVYVDEWVGRMRVQGRMFIGDVVPGRSFSYRFGFPSSLASAGGSFRFEPEEDGACSVIQETHFGFRLPLLGPLLDAVLRLFVPVGEIARHMREEQANLVELLGAG